MKYITIGALIGMTIGLWIAVYIRDRPAPAYDSSRHAFRDSIRDDSPAPRLQQITISPLVDQWEQTAWNSLYRQRCITLSDGTLGQLDSVGERPPTVRYSLCEFGTAALTFTGPGAIELH